jgi:hypothetical protein
LLREQSFRPIPSSGFAIGNLGQWNHPGSLPDGSRQHKIGAAAQERRGIRGDEIVVERQGTTALRENSFALRGAGR